MRGVRIRRQRVSAAILLVFLCAGTIFAGEFAGPKPRRPPLVKRLVLRLFEIWSMPKP